MTNGPAATIGEILDVKLARPRDRLALAEDPEFIHYRQQVLQFLYEKQKNPVSADSESDSEGEQADTTATKEPSKEASPEKDIVSLAEVASASGHKTAAA